MPQSYIIASGAIQERKDWSLTPRYPTDRPTYLGPIMYMLYELSSAVDPGRRCGPSTIHISQILSVPSNGTTVPCPLQQGPLISILSLHPPARRPQFRVDTSRNKPSASYISLFLKSSTVRRLRPSSAACRRRPLHPPAPQDSSTVVCPQQANERGRIRHFCLLSFICHPPGRAVGNRDRKA